MSTLLVSVDHADYVLSARLAHANLGPLASSIYFYATPWSGVVGADPGGPALVQCVLTKPAGAVVAHAIVLSQAAPGGDFIQHTGDAGWARWVNGNGVIVAEGDVSDDAGSGAFKIAGTAGTKLYAGGRFFLSTSALT